MSESLINKYRPKAFSEVFGNEGTIGALQRVLKSPSCPHSFLFTGPSGVGKTTLARILATEFDAEYYEVDAASNNGVDAMRALAEFGQHMSFSKSGRRVLTLDECFAPGTRVNTPSGFRNIETLRPGDYVIGAYGPHQVKRVFKNRVEVTRINQLCLENGRDILCSADHAFLTNKGWIAAKDITNAERLFTSSSCIPYKMLKMWDRNYEQRRRQQSKMPRMPQENLSRMWRYFYNAENSLLATMRKLSSSTQTILSARRSMAEFYAISSSPSCCQSSGQGIGRDAFQPYANKKSDARSPYCSQNDSNQESQWYTNTKEALAKREWPAIWSSADRVISSFVEWCSRICNYYTARITNQFKRGALLQSRYSNTAPTLSNRNRWLDTQFSKSQGIRRKERPYSFSDGMACIKSNKPASRQRIQKNIETHTINSVEYAYLYDLEIDGHPSYAVEDIIVHNCHMLSRSAWNAVLKLTEEPPDHLYMAFCTTEPSKVPETIITRCYHTSHKPITPQEMDALLSTVSELEGWKVNNDVMQLVIAAGTGQPRKALSVLLKVYDAPSRDEARRIISLPEGSDQLIRILRHLIEGKKSWVQLRPMLLKLEDDNFEETSIAAARYIMGALLNTESQEKAIGIWNLLEALVFPAQTWDKKVAFIAAIGRMLWGGGA